MTMSIKLERVVVGRHREKYVARLEFRAEGTIEYTGVDEFGHDIRDREPETAKEMVREVTQELTKRVHDEIVRYVYKNLKTPNGVVSTPIVKDKILFINPELYAKVQAGKLTLNQIFGLQEVKKPHVSAVPGKEKARDSSTGGK